MHDIKTIVASMEPYIYHSCFIGLIEEQAVIPEDKQPYPPSCTETPSPSVEDIEALNELLAKLKDVKQHVSSSGHQDEVDLINALVGFVYMLQSKIPMTGTEEQYRSSRVIRTAIVSVLPKFLRRVRREPTTMIAAAYYFATALVVPHIIWPDPSKITKAIVSCWDRLVAC
jgi:hypothetical protein